MEPEGSLPPSQASATYISADWRFVCRVIAAGVYILCEGLCVCMWVCVCVCVCVYALLRTYIRTYVRMYVCMYFCPRCWYNSSQNIYYFPTQHQHCPNNSDWSICHEVSAAPVLSIWNPYAKCVMTLSQKISRKDKTTRNIYEICYNKS